MLPNNRLFYYLQCKPLATRTQGSNVNPPPAANPEPRATPTAGATTTNSVRGKVIAKKPRSSAPAARTTTPPAAPTESSKGRGRGASKASKGTPKTSTGKGRGRGAPKASAAKFQVK